MGSNVHASTSAEGLTAQGVTPVLIHIPKFNLSVTVESCSLKKDGSLELPESGDVAGWFTNSSKPGASGNAVIAGHVDDFTGPAAFFPLKNLVAGDEIIVESADSQTLVFQVTDLKAYPRENAPIQQIFGYSSKPRLNLITCHGLFNRDLKTHEERLVIFTDLKG
ncbi:class F sortase [Salipaludibacillus sp. CUR1]|uniref:class F sortase n=1 Tax=Salipaludibacillus sp. CUR1 TaxID=2820003 RepID=UPI001E3A9B96|nr:class F sortase [Salipaludibacillus sp. CUR1]MCE7793730.1 class F sortase [Salipaludibacillus sp. CUR1]